MQQTNQRKSNPTLPVEQRRQNINHEMQIYARVTNGIKPYCNGSNNKRESNKEKHGWKSITSVIKNQKSKKIIVTLRRNKNLISWSRKKGSNICMHACTRGIKKATASNCRIKLLFIFINHVDELYLGRTCTPH